MKKGNIAAGILFAVLVVGAFGTFFMYTSSSPSALVPVQFTKEQTQCMIDCYEELRTEEMAGMPMSQKRLEYCINYCQSI